MNTDWNIDSTPCQAAPESWLRRAWSRWFGKKIVVTAQRVAVPAQQIAEGAIKYKDLGSS